MTVVTVVTMGLGLSAHPQALHQGLQLWQGGQSDKVCVGSSPALPRGTDAGVQGTPCPVAQLRPHQPV